MDLKTRPKNSFWLANRTIAFLLGIVFLLAACSKLGNLSDFQKILAEYGYIPVWLRGTAILLIPGLELILGICLLTGINQKEAAFLAILLLIGFLGLGLYGTLIGSTGGCGCFKLQLPVLLQLKGWGMVIRNLILFGFACFVFLFTMPEMAKYELESAKNSKN